MVKKYYYGGVYITNDDGALVLKDAVVAGGSDDQTIVDQTLATVPATLFFTMHKRNRNGSYEVSTIRRGMLEYFNVGYVDAAGADQLQNVHLLNGIHADNQYRQQEKLVWQSGALAEGVNFKNKSTDGLPAPIHLDAEGKLYFMTEWGTIINVSEAGEYFYMKVCMTEEF